MDRLSLHATERTLLGKKVKNLRKEGQLPGHVFGKGVDGENVLVTKADFLKTFHQAGETGLIDLKIGAEKVRPVLIREVQHDPVSGDLIHVDFYQVNLSEKVKVPVPIELIGEQPEKVHLGEAIVLQTLNEVEVEALPTDLIEKLEVDISGLKEIGDAITIGQLILDREKLTVHADAEEVVAKLAPAVSAETEKLLEEQAAEQAAAAAETEAGASASAEASADKEGAAASAEGSGEPKEGEAAAEGEAPAEEPRPKDDQPLADKKEE